MSTNMLTPEGGKNPWTIKISHVWINLCANTNFSSWKRRAKRKAGSINLGSNLRLWSIPKTNPQYDISQVSFASQVHCDERHARESIPFTVRYRFRPWPDCRGISGRNPFLLQRNGNLPIQKSSMWSIYLGCSWTWFSDVSFGLQTVYWNVRNCGVHAGLR